MVNMLDVVVSTPRKGSARECLPQARSFRSFRTCRNIQLCFILLSAHLFHDHVNNILAQSLATGVPAYRLAKLGSHKGRGEYFADTSETTRINLKDRYYARLEDPLKYHAIMCVFASGNTDADGFEFTPDAGVTNGAIERVSFM